MRCSNMLQHEARGVTTLCGAAPAASFPAALGTAGRPPRRSIRRRHASATSFTAKACPRLDARAATASAMSRAHSLAPARSRSTLRCAASSARRAPPRARSEQLDAHPARISFHRTSPRRLYSSIVCSIVRRSARARLCR